MNYKGLRDRHLNVFCGYAKDHLENNITKAFVNVLDSLTENELRNVLHDLLGITIPEEPMRVEFYLQSSPSVNLVLSIPEERRLLFAFSPTGKTYDALEGVDRNDDAALTKALEKIMQAQASGEIDSEELARSVKERITDIRGRHNKESIPDGWLLIYVNEEPLYVVGMEDKRYDLDPFQLRNHLIKGMHCDKNKPHEIIYRKFHDITNVLDQIGGYMSSQFHEYLIILGYLEAESILDVAKADQKIRQMLGAKYLGKELARLFPGLKIDQRHWYSKRVNDYDWTLKEINVESNADGIYIPLAIGTTMRIAKELFSRVNAPFPKDLCRHCIGVWPTFHFQDQWGRNVRKSYICNDDVPYDRYFNFWKKHAEEGRRLKPRNGEPQELLRKMFEGNCLSNHALSEMMAHFSSHSIPVCAVPESMINLFWSWEEIAEMPSNEYFFSQLLSELTTVFDYLGIVKK